MAVPKSSVFGPDEVRALGLGLILYALAAVYARGRGTVLPGFSFMGWVIPKSGAAYAAAFATGEQRYQLPRNLLARVAWQESRFRPDIINGETTSSAGAVGIMQIVPRWHPTVNPLNPFESIFYAGAYLRSLFNQFDSWPLALAAYNWGPGNVRTALDASRPFSTWPLETRDYVRQISADLGLEGVPA